uniref:Uncharacterized protein n=1 Tax=Romanomermis culicivorax TaxID=13658 RepID=A0A915I6F8_ROMCU
MGGCVRMTIFRFLTIAFLQNYCRLIAGYAFENCDDSSTHHGNCTVVQRDGAIGSESVNSIILNGGYSDFGKKSGCPYEAGACQKGFSFYGWVKFFAYITPCENYGVYVSNQQFAIHLQGNGRLSVYVWMKNDAQWQAESVQPVQLGFWYPLILQFDYNRTLGNGTMVLWLQSQQVAFSNCTEKRTFKPVADNMVFGGDDHFTNIQIDRTNWDSEIQSMEHIVGVLIDPPAREGNCHSKPYSTLTRPFQCFWLQKDDHKNWTEAYKACDIPAYDAGYPYGRLARFQPENKSFTWRASEPKFKEATGSGQKPGYLAWLGGGRRSHWLNREMTIVGDITVPPDVVYNGANATDESCLALDTSGRKWQWVESDCSKKLGYVCEMSWDCVLQNPCQNYGACIPVTDGPTCKCYPGSSGKFCERGAYEPYCLNNCPCSVEFKICQAPTPDQKESH